MSTPLHSIEIPHRGAREFLLHRGCAPRAFNEDGALILAAYRPQLPDDIAEMAFWYGTSVIVENASREEVEQLIERLAHSKEMGITGGEIIVAGEEDTADARNLASQPPVIRYVNLVIREAYDAGASDIHFEATRKGLSTRFRLDGVLTAGPEPPPGLYLAVLSRVKLLAKLDIAERRRPQDGRIRIRLENQELDLRVSSVPTFHGESIVIRLLERGSRPTALTDLGMDEATLSLLIKMAKRPHGMILVTGPTGSGKTTTLYGALKLRRSDAEKIITVEDPIEYQLPGITQVPINRETGMTFVTALRSILRQDPDVLMVGEMRDGETAALAIQAAMTGHLVFSTLHTNDAMGAIPRLLDLGIPPYLVAATLDGVMAQRLVRRICAQCRAIGPAISPEIVELSHGALEGVLETRATGCPACRHTGYRGRVGLFEVLTLSDPIRQAIAENRTRQELAAMAAAEGVHTLKDDGWEKVRQGITTVEEVLRVAEA